MSSESTDKRPTPGRLPSLTQLAARISERSPSSISPSGASPSNLSRPRLPTSLLARTASSSSTKEDGQKPSATDNTPSEALGSLSLDDKHKEEEKSPAGEGHSSSAPPRGYKNVPSLEAITERMAMVRARTAESASGEPKDSKPKAVTEADAESPTETKDEDPEEGEISEDASEGVKEADHPLQHTWTLYHDSKARLATQTADPSNPNALPPPPGTATDTGAYEAGLTVIGEFNTVEGFCRYFNWLKPPSQLERNSNYHMFKDGIKPMWEDKANANGGKWVLTMKSNPALLDRCWSWLTMALVGEELDERDEICGAVVSLRAKIDRIQLWLRMKDDIERINSIGKKLVKLLDLAGESGIGLEFQYNTEDRPTHSKFISIIPSSSNSYFRSRGDNPSSAAPDTGGSQQPTSAPGFQHAFGGMGSFSTGGTGTWRTGTTGLGRSGSSASSNPLGRGNTSFGNQGGNAAANAPAGSGTTHGRNNSATGSTS
ncbi:hypothetical protein FRC02_007416 [Tulasnella sp. 418]|nr:hypothetical protein FRC02_007416 [Tulasnella sp. 418]